MKPDEPVANKLRDKTNQFYTDRDGTGRSRWHSLKSPVWESKKFPAGMKRRKEDEYVKRQDGDCDWRSERNW